MKIFSCLSFTAVVLLGTMAVIFPETALATEAAMRADTGPFADAAEVIFDLIDGTGGMLVALTAGSLGAIGLIRGWNTGVAVGALGTGIAATQAGPIMLNVLGTALLH